jgi:hypothetical protein
MNPAKVLRENVRRFVDLPNIGPAAAKDFELLGFSEPSQLVGADPLKLYQSLDVFMSVTSFLQGESPEPWWNFTERRRRQYGQL